MANAQFDDYESARERADREATRTKRHIAVVEDEGEFYVMTMRNADRYARWPWLQQDVLRVLRTPGWECRALAPSQRTAFRRWRLPEHEALAGGVPIP
jgi:hypothetical protein